MIANSFKILYRSLNLISLIIIIIYLILCMLRIKYNLQYLFFISYFYKYIQLFKGPSYNFNFGPSPFKLLLLFLLFLHWLRRLCMHADPYMWASRICSTPGWFRTLTLQIEGGVRSNFSVEGKRDRAGRAC